MSCEDCADYLSAAAEIQVLERENLDLQRAIEGLSQRTADLESTILDLRHELADANRRADQAESELRHSRSYDGWHCP